MEFNREWLERFKYAHMIHHKLLLYCSTAPQFSDAEIMGNILISSVLFAETFTRNTLNASTPNAQLI